jgi:hypothetical protein
MTIPQDVNKTSNHKKSTNKEYENKKIQVQRFRASINLKQTSNFKSSRRGQ